MKNWGRFLIIGTNFRRPDSPNTIEEAYAIIIKIQNLLFAFALVFVSWRGILGRFEPVPGEL